MSRRTRLPTAVFVLTLLALGPLVPACAMVPRACESACVDEASDACQQCIAREDAKREEARRKRAEQRKQAPQSYPSGSGSGY